MPGVDREVESQLEQWQAVFSDIDPAARLEELTGEKFNRLQVQQELRHLSKRVHAHAAGPSRATPLNQLSIYA